MTETFLCLQQWHAGDRTGLDRLLERDLPWVRERVRARLGPLLRGKGELDDFVHDAMIEVLQYGPRFVVSDRDQFRALVARITENTLRDHAVRLRSMKRDVARERPVVTDSVLQLDPPVDSVARPSALVHEEQERAWIRLAIELLAPDDRDLVRMREWEELSFTEIGERLAVSEDAARMRFHRVLPRLARQVERLRAGELPELLRAAENP